MNFGNNNWRERRNLLNHPSFGPIHYTIANYSTKVDKKSDLNSTLEPDLLDKFRSIPDPLKKNLADTVITTDQTSNRKMPPDPRDFYYTEIQSENMQDSIDRNRSDFYPSLAGITTFFSNFFGAISGAMFQRRPKSPTTQYYDCFDDNIEDNSQMSLSTSWQSPKMGDQNKNLAPEPISTEYNMNNCRSAVENCENKLNAVKNLLSSKSAPRPTKFRTRRPRKQFVEPGSVEECFEDAFSVEDFVALANDEYIEYFSVPNSHKEDLCEIDGPKMKIEIAPVKESIEIVKTLADIEDKIVNPSLQDSDTCKIGTVSRTEGKMILEVEEKVEIPNPLRECKNIINDPEVETTNKNIEASSPELKDVLTPLVSNLVSEINPKSDMPSSNPDILRSITEVSTQSEIPISKEEQSNVMSKVETSITTLENKSVDVADNKEIISTCEEKLARLKSLLQEKCKKPSKKCLDSTVSTLEPVNETKIEKPIVNSSIHNELPNRMVPTEKLLGKPPKKPTKIVPVDKVHDKKFKNRNRVSGDKRKKCKIRKNIQDDTLFANEIDSGELSSHQGSPVNVSALNRLSEPISIPTVDGKEFFDEVKGRFHSSSTTESEDSFQIVFTDSPKITRMRRPSDCDSEDSFIVFEDPDSCYTSNDVFGDNMTSGESEDDFSDSESDVSDSGCVSEVCKIAHSFSRTVSDLTDGSLYDNVYVDKQVADVSADEVDCSARIAEGIADEEISESVKATEEILEKPGLLVTEAKKQLKKSQPPKRVSFSSKPPKVHVMRVWSFAARQARAGHWETHARDRERFQRRIADVDMAISWVLKPQHRSRVVFQRFMPWWNALRRKELAEKKQREAEEKLKREEDERKREEEERKRLEEEKELERIKEEEQRIQQAEIDKRKEESRLKSVEEFRKIVEQHNVRKEKMNKAMGKNCSYNVGKSVVKVTNSTKNEILSKDVNLNTDKEILKTNCRKLDSEFIENDSLKNIEVDDAFMSNESQNNMEVVTANDKLKEIPISCLKENISGT